MKALFMVLLALSAILFIALMAGAVTSEIQANREDRQTSMWHNLRPWVWEIFAVASLGGLLVLAGR